MDSTLDTLRNNFDTKVQDALLAEVHQTMVDDALMLWVVHDVNPHAFCQPEVQEFVPAQRLVPGPHHDSHEVMRVLHPLSACCLHCLLP
jgi:hypothetical protein